MSPGRPRTFDPDAGLPVIRQIFWEQGFNGVTLDAIAAALGVSKPTLCKALGDKEAIFARALEHYHEQYGMTAARALTAGATLKDSLIGWFQVSVDRIVDPNTPCGCLIIDTAMCGTFTTGPIAATLDRLQRQTLPVLVSRLEQAQKDGELSEDADADLMAQYLAVQQAALSAFSRGNPSRARLGQFISFILDGLPWSR